MCVCDIQGVGDLYTDPQVHTADGQGFGQGNCGRIGINKFLGSHRCNEICQFMGLSAIRMEQAVVPCMYPPTGIAGQLIEFQGPDDRNQQLRMPPIDLSIGRAPGSLFDATVMV